MASRDRPARGARPARLLDAGSGVDGRGLGFKTRFDSYVYVPKRPLALASLFPACRRGRRRRVWSSPANIAALAARHRHGWAVVPWWNTFTRERRSLPRRVAEPWVRYFFRSGDAWLAGGSRHARDVVRLGADPNRTVIAPLTALGPNPPLERTGSSCRVSRAISSSDASSSERDRRCSPRSVVSIAESSGWPVTARSVPVVEEASGDPRIRFLIRKRGVAARSVPAGGRPRGAVSLRAWGLVVHEGSHTGCP